MNKRVIKKVGDEISLVSKDGDKVTCQNIYGQEAFDAAFRFVGTIDHQDKKKNSPTPKPINKPKR
ncbi:hypothetical protein P3549_20735 [Vibrio parahaemolyticus]|nr:hypothetical protein [Vibrio parahaemolyticus]